MLGYATWIHGDVDDASTLHFTPIKAYYCKPDPHIFNTSVRSLSETQSMHGHD
ncbi:hypothetical protein ACTXT7_017266 [Hymenolepis weldensis]